MRGGGLVCSATASTLLVATGVAGVDHALDVVALEQLLDGADPLGLALLRLGLELLGNDREVGQRPALVLGIDLLASIGRGIEAHDDVLDRLTDSSEPVQRRLRCCSWCCVARRAVPRELEEIAKIYQRNRTVSSGDLLCSHESILLGERIGPRSWRR